MRRDIIRLVNVEKHKGRQPVLHNIWMNIFAGQVIGLAGINRSGKALLARILSGTQPADGGKIYIDGQKMPSFQAAASALHDMSRYVGKQSLCFDSLSVSENLLLLQHRSPWSVIRREDMEQAGAALKRAVPSIEPQRHMSELSPDEKAYYEMLLLTLSGARLIILDEHIDVLYRRYPQRVRELLRIGLEREIAFVLISTDIDLLTALCNELLILRNGGSVMQIGANEYCRKEIITMLTVQQNESVPRAPAFGRDREEIVFQGEALVFCEGDADMNFSVRGGEIVSIVSLDNNWHRSLMRVLLGERRLCAGSLRLKGRALTAQELRFPCGPKRRLCVLPHADWRKYLFPSLSLADNLLLSAMYKISIGPFGYVGNFAKRFAEAHLLKSGIVTDLSAAEGTAETLDEQSVMRLVMERVRLYHAECLILCDPTETADFSLRRSLIRECRLCAEKGIAVLSFFTNIRDALEMSDRVILCKGHRIIEEFCVTGREDPRELLQKL